MYIPIYVVRLTLVPFLRCFLAIVIETFCTFLALICIYRQKVSADAGQNVPAEATNRTAKKLEIVLLLAMGSIQ